MKRLRFEEHDAYDIPGHTWDSLNEPQVKRIVEMTAEVENMTFEGAARSLAESWEAQAFACKKVGLSSWKMWDRLGMLALGLSARED